MVEEKVKEAFSKVREEMKELQQEVADIKQELNTISSSVELILHQFQQKKANLSAESSAEVLNRVPKFRERFKKEFLGTQAHRKSVILKNLGDLELKEPVSIGNEGVSALRQQSGSTQAHSEFDLEKEFTERQQQKPIKEPGKDMLQQNVERLKHALQDIFKKLTRQEFVIFSLLYQLEDELKRPVSYKDLADRSALTSNSIRDYISKLIAKKVPIIKEKYNNRQILLKVAPELRNIETLESLMKIVEKE